MAQCIQTLKVCKSDDEEIVYAFDLTQAFARNWEPDFPFSSTDATRPPLDRASGFEYLSSGGQTASQEPDWQNVVITDGSLTWTPQAMSNSSLRFRISTATWIPVSGVTLSDENIVETPGLQEVSVKVGGGTAGQRYVISCLITTLDLQVFEVRIQLTIDR